MFFNIFKSKKSRKEQKTEEEKTSVSEERQSLHIKIKETSKTPRTQSIAVPKPVTRIRKMSRLSGYSSSSSIGQLSVATQASTMSSKSTKSTKSNWSYNIDRFKGSQNIHPKMRSTGHADLWAQAYAFGGR